ncbi:MAG: DUF1684 domain-containing protein [Flavobacteriales bacterium]
MKAINVLLTFFLVFSCQKKIKRDTLLEARNFQSDIVAFYNGSQSPIKIENKKKFKGITFFPVDKKYQIEADFTRIKEGEVLEFQTSSGEIKKYMRFGIIAFEFDEKMNKLTVFQKISEDSEDIEDLFLPFSDETNGISSYGGGRYINLSLRDIDRKMLLDFNKAYNPYCAYEDGYSCPVPPIENRLDISIEAGVSYKSY